MEARDVEAWWGVGSLNNYLLDTCATSHTPPAQGHSAVENKVEKFACEDRGSRKAPAYPFNTCKVALRLEFGCLLPRAHFVTPASLYPLHPDSISLCALQRWTVSERMPNSGWQSSNLKQRFTQDLLVPRRAAGETGAALPALLPGPTSPKGYLRRCPTLPPGLPHYGKLPGALLRFPAWFPSTD